MSLPLRHQPLQSPYDYIQSPEEQKAFGDIVFGSTSRLIRFFWGRFGANQVSDKITRTRHEQPPPSLSQYFVYNKMRIVDGEYAVKKPSACCKKCETSPALPLNRYTKPPFTCAYANPQASGVNCPPWHGLPTKEYLYNDFYLCCATDPFGLTAGQRLTTIKHERDITNHSQLLFNTNGSHRKLEEKTRRILGSSTDKMNHFVATRVSTS